MVFYACMHEITFLKSFYFENFLLRTKCVVKIHADVLYKYKSLLSIHNGRFFWQYIHAYPYQLPKVYILQHSYTAII